MKELEIVKISQIETMEFKNKRSGKESLAADLRRYRK